MINSDSLENVQSIVSEYSEAVACISVFMLSLNEMRTKYKIIMFLYILFSLLNNIGEWPKTTISHKYTHDCTEYAHLRGITK